ncbi:YceI family protein [Hyphobacterium sp. HN65]|uniref:YceI family protein n=1 Tax=Hyphobacterium lacteum TaxID=3116575 RepID=A0ABU7LSM0_9PROT|nr:YceI family protein [Hyphobacterium sp. HN65]MEE2526917.1 YceI family protein [Hyphobacterium sp. HN65]
MFKPWSVFFVALALVACSQPAPVQSGDWQIRASLSDVSFVSVKNGNVVEVSRFERFRGGISETGAIQLTIMTESVETYVDDRNFRLQDIFFLTPEFPQITVSAQVDPVAFDDLTTGEPMTMTLPLAVAFSGEVREAWADIRITRLAENRVSVTSIEPVLVDIRDFGLDERLDALRASVNLNSITPVIPVSVHLVLERS